MRDYIILLILISLFFAADISADTDTIEKSPRQNIEHNKPYSLFSSPFSKLSAEFYANSSDFTRQGAGAEFGTSDDAGLHLGAGYIFSEFSQDGFDDIMRHTLFIQGEKYFSEKFGVKARVSENLYDNENENLNGGVFIRYKPFENVFTETGYRHFDIIDTVLPFNNIIYSYVVTIGAAVLDIKSDDYKFFLLYHPASSVSLAGEVVYGDYSDGNEKLSLMLEAGYQWFDNPYVRTAYNYFYLDINYPAPLVQGRDHSESAYWDPVNFETHTIRLELRRDLNEHVSLGAEAALSYCPKSGGLSESAFLSAAYNFTEQLSLNADARWFDQDKGIDRLGETGRFWATNFNAALQYRF